MIIKKLLFGLLFLISFWFTLTYITSLFIGTDVLFSFSLQIITTIVIGVGLIALDCILFTLFVSLAQGWAFILPVIVIAAIIPLVSFIPSPTLTLATHRVIISLGTLIALSFATLLLFKKLKTYLTFQPTVLLSPTTKTLAQLMLILFSIAYFITINAVITQNGFQIPPSLIDTAVSMISPSQLQGGETSVLSQDQLNQLKRNPQQLDQSLNQLGVDPQTKQNIENMVKTASLDQINQTLIQNELTNVKKQVNDQINTAIKPYIPYIPPVMAILFYFSLAFFLMIMLIFVSPIIWFIFFLLEKTGYVHFTAEMREVKKMVV